VTTDLNFWRSAITLASLLLFLVLVARTWSRSRREGFEDAAQLPFTDEGTAEDAAPAARAPRRGQA
jgi:cbb3-type cytochrome oxidase subunit 3